MKTNQFFLAAILANSIGASATARTLSRRSAPAVILRKVGDNGGDNFLIKPPIRWERLRTAGRSRDWTHNRLVVVESWRPTGFAMCSRGV